MFGLREEWKPFFSDSEAAAWTTTEDPAAGVPILRSVVCSELGGERLVPLHDRIERVHPELDFWSVSAEGAAKARFTHHKFVPNMRVCSHQTAGLSTLLVGTLVRTETFSWRKLAAVVISLTGVVLVITASNSEGEESGLLGDCLAILSALLYGFYATLVKKCM
ncbi:MAG: hypothetical protein BJ554DRAFT_4279, partial [Olpidium bornovanus]